jgi:hypothetical protein
MMKSMALIHRLAAHFRKKMILEKMLTLKCKVMMTILEPFCQRENSSPAVHSPEDLQHMFGDRRPSDDKAKTERRNMSAL